jgi:DNA-binding transcriptional regulator YiaG
MDLDEGLQLTRLRALLASGSARSIRRAHGLSLRETGEIVGVGPATILRWERGDRVPRPSKEAFAYWVLLRKLMEASR